MTHGAIDTLSVVFTDLVGSTELRSRLGEERADEVRRAHDQVQAAAVAQHGGQVVKGLGDGILATFASAADAVAAAVAMQQAVESASRADPDAPAGLRVGVSVGDVQVENGDVFGAPVVEASRLCAIATGGEILVADLVRALARGRGGFTFEPMGDLELKGIAEPVPTCRVSWIPLAGLSDQQAGALPLPSLLASDIATRYVGRDAVLDRIRRAWQEARAGSTRTLLLAGEPGIGKTRTAGELAREAHADGAIVLYGRCDEDLGVPYQPFVEALDWYTGHAEAPVLGRLPGELARLLPELGARVGGLPPAVASDPRSEEHRLFEATASWLADLSREGGLVLVLDDLHWSAKPTLLLFLHVLRAAACAEPTPAPLLVICTYRDTDIDRAHPLSALLGELRRLPGVERVPLEGLTAPEIMVFLETAAGHELDEGARLLAAALHAETEGNPFFIGEVLRHLIEVGQVRRQGDRWVVEDAEHVSVPEGVRDVVGRRLSRLSDEANAVLAVAAVIGRDVDLDVLLPIVDAGEAAVLDALDAAVRARLLEETGPDQFRFGHALVRTTLYDELSATRRRRLHRRVADVLEKVRPHDVVALAHHAVEGGPEGGDVTRAVRYSIAAGQQALARRANADAEIHFHQAVELLDDVGDDESPVAVEARIGLGEAQRDQANPAFRDTLLDAARKARAAGYDELLVRAVLADYRGMPSIVGGVDWDRVELTEAALDAVGPAATADRARVLAHLASEISFSGDEARRLGLAEEAEALARSLGDPDLVAWVVIRAGYAMMSGRGWRELPDRLREIVDITDGSGDPARRALARFWLAAALMTAGDMHDARSLLDEALEIARRDGAPLYEWMLRAVRVHHLAQTGALDEAEAENQACLEVGRALGAPDAEAWGAAVLAPIVWGRGLGPRDQTELMGLFSDLYPLVPEWRNAHIWYLAESERRDEALAALSAHPSDPEGLVDRPLPFHALFALAFAAYFLDDAELAERVEAALEPHADAWSHYVGGSTGPVITALAACAGARGDLDLAIARFEAAASAAAGQRFLVGAAWFRFRVAEMLLRRNQPGDRGQAEAIVAELQDRAVEFNAPVLAERALALLTPS